MTSTLLRWALAYAERGWRVFPLHTIYRGKCTCGCPDCSSPGKHPLTRRGLHEATTDPEVIETWWRQWRRANVALVTGAESRLAVVDIDLPASLPSLDALVEGEFELPRTLCALTGGGGIHLFFMTRDATLANAVGGLPGHPGELPGIDLRANGGYVVAPPSTHRSGIAYSWAWPSHPLAVAPAWLRQPSRPRLGQGSAGRADFAGDGSAYGLAVLRAELHDLQRATVGSRNHQLNRVAFALAQIVAGGELLEAAARAAALQTALEIGLSEAEARQTLESAFVAGARSPRSAPHRLR